MKNGIIIVPEAARARKFLEAFGGELGEDLYFNIWVGCL
jgi:hypothetical protein